MAKKQIIGLDSLILTYYKTERQIRTRLSNLINYGKECDCKSNIETIELIDDYDFWDSRSSMKVTNRYCLVCGGVVEDI